MNDYMAMALMDIGKNLPAQLRQNRLDKQALIDKKRQYMTDDLANELSRMEISSKKDSIAEDQAAKTAIDDATRGIQRQKQFEDLNALEEMVGMKKGDYNIMSNREVVENTNVPKFAGSDRAKEFMSTFVEKPEENSVKTAGLESKIDQKDKELQLREKLSDDRIKNQQQLTDDRLRQQQSQFDERLRVLQSEGEKNRNTKGNNLKPEEKVSNAQNVIDKIDLLVQHPGFKTRVGAKGLSSGFGLLKSPVSGTPGAGFDAEFNALKSMLTMENLGKMKGTLSDSDMKVLTQAASSLDINMPEADFKRELSRVKGVMSKISATPSTTDDTTSKKDQFGFTVGEKRYSKKYGKELTYMGNNQWQ